MGAAVWPEGLAGRGVEEVVAVIVDERPRLWRGAEVGVWGVEAVLGAALMDAASFAAPAMAELVSAE